jgi:ribulose-phosphate 3-epimerase
MTTIAPCITVESEDLYKESVQKFTEFAERVHIDVSDGEFAPTFLVSGERLWWPENWQTDIHAMVKRPSEYVQQLIDLKPSLIIFHVEVEEDLTTILQKIQAAGIKAGISLLRPTVPSSVVDLIQLADHVMIFSGELGHYGGTASLMQLEKVRLIRGIKPNIEVGWDGGVTIDNAFSLSQGGVDVLNVGGAIAKSADPAATYKSLIGEINKHSVI